MPAASGAGSITHSVTSNVASPPIAFGYSTATIDIPKVVTTPVCEAAAAAD